MSYIALNAFAIAVAALASLGFGAAYIGVVNRLGPVALADSAAKSMALVALTFVAEFWLASILAGALILAPREAGHWTMALGTALVIWIGFVVPVLLVTHRYRGLPARFAIVDCGHWLGAMIAQAAVLQAIGVRPPLA